MYTSAVASGRRLCQALLSVSLPTIDIGGRKAGLGARAVLVHHVDERVRTEPGEEREHLLALRDQSRHDQVADEQTAHRESIRAHHEVADLALHLGHRAAHDLGVVARRKVPLGGLGVEQLDVGHVDVDDAVEERQRLDGVVPAGVVDDRDAQALRDSNGQCGEDLCDDVRRCDEVQVVATHVLHVEEDGGELRRSELLPGRPVRDLAVLTEPATQVTAAEEHRPRAGSPAEDRLLAVVWAIARDSGTGADAADTAGAGRTVDTAAARTELASGEQSGGALRAPPELAALAQGDVGGSACPAGRSHRIRYGTPVTSAQGAA